MHGQERAVTAPVAEMFSSVQGEGPFVGVRQLFVRTYGCDLHCRYCDTPAAKATTGPCLVEAPAGSREWRTLENPLSVADAMGLVEELDQPPGLHHSLALTGGEPLLHAEFAGELAAACGERGLLAYLETNGLRVAELAQVITRLDVVAMDVKLASSLDEGAGLNWETLLSRSMAFLRVALAKDVFVKAVCTPETTEGEIERVAEAIAGETRECPLILQPVTPAAEVAEAPTARQMLKLQAAALGCLADVRVIPQCHLLMGQL